MLKHVEFPSTRGGALITTAPPEAIGADNFAVRKNFRRVDGVDQITEGWGHFHPDGTTDILEEGFDGDVTLIVTARQANGAKCTVVGTATSLYRHWVGFSFVEDGFVVDGFFEDLAGWEVIGTGYSPNGHRWEAENCAGYLILNNGVDLPLCYRPYDTEVKPLKELRESGIASVGAITEIAGVMLYGGLTVIPGDELATLMASPSPYAAYSSETSSKFHWRIAFGKPGQPDRMAPAVECSTTEGSKLIELAHPMGSLQVGDTVLIAGAGINGGNLTTDVELIHPNGTTVQVSEAPQTTVEDDAATLIKADAASSIGGLYEDLTGDGDGITAMAKLGRVVVVYKESSLFIGSYTGDLAAPFLFERIAAETTASLPIKHRHTLTRVMGQNGEFHVYAGVDTFYLLDNVNRIPRIVPALHAARSVFFQNGVIPAQADLWAAANLPAQEVWFRFPAVPGGDTMLRFDYRYNQCFTSDIDITAAASIEDTGTDMFVMGGAEPSRLLRYGYTNAPELQSGGSGLLNSFGHFYQSGGMVLPQSLFGAWSIQFETGEVFALKGSLGAVWTVYDPPPAGLISGYYKLIPRVYSRLGTGYTSTLESGREAFGNPHTEKQVAEHVLLLKEPYSGPVTISVLGSRTASGPQVTLASRSITDAQEALTPTFGAAHYLADRVTVTGANRLVEIAGRIMAVDGVNTRSWGRQA